MTLDWFTIIASAASILSLLFAAWIYHKSEIQQKNHEIANAALEEKALALSKLSIVALHSIQHLIRYCDDENVPVANIQEIARQSRINIAGLADLSAVTAESIKNWSLAEAFGSELNRKNEHGKASRDTQ